MISNNEESQRELWGIRSHPAHFENIFKKWIFNHSYMRPAVTGHGQFWLAREQVSISILKLINISDSLWTGGWSSIILVKLQSLTTNVVLFNTASHGQIIRESGIKVLFDLNSVFLHGLSMKSLQDFKELNKNIQCFWQSCFTRWCFLSFCS